MSSPSESTSRVTATRTTVYDSADPNGSLLSVNMANITRLTDTNYLMWSRQVAALLEGLELHTFLTKSDSTPSATTIVNGVAITNPTYAPWRRQDRLLYSALIVAISVSVQPLVASATTTYEVWQTLEGVFGMPTRGHIRQLKFQIKSCTKGNKKISEYLRVIKTKTDELTFLGKPMDHEDLIEQILVGYRKSRSQRLMQPMHETT